jgi:hypothetical protein
MVHIRTVAATFLQFRQTNLFTKFVWGQFCTAPCVDPQSMPKIAEFNVTIMIRSQASSIYF